MKAADLLAKAAQAARSARLLLSAGDPDGACNRAYYAMFDAARAALIATGQDVGKTHRGVLNAFSERLVKAGAIPRETGRLLNLETAVGRSDVLAPAFFSRFGCISLARGGAAGGGGGR